MISHILNGDSTLSIWKHHQFDGDPIVFREMLVEGDCTAKLFSDDFFYFRRNFFKQYYGIPIPKYDKITFQELQKLNKLSDVDEIILWFENDLFCQINLMAVLSFFHSTNFDIQTISLIKVEGNKGLGEYKIEDYPRLFNNRITLNDNDLEFATKFWEKFTNEKLESLLPFMHTYNNSFSYLSSSVKAHIERFPDPISGITKLERRILKFLGEEPMTSHKLIGKLLKRQRWEGFGDLQYEKMIQNMAPDLIELKEKKYHLTINGKQILRGVKKFDDSHLSYITLGGVKRSDYYFDSINNLVIERK